MPVNGAAGIRILAFLLLNPVSLFAGREFHKIVARFYKQLRIIKKRIPIEGIRIIPWVIIVGPDILFFFRPQVNFTTFNLEIGLGKLVNFFDDRADDCACYGHFTVFAINFRV
jgi:hypothetical protein